MNNTTETKIYSPKKLIEVALPLDDINVAAAREKSIRHGHPSTLHLWWARRPLAAARAVIFAQMVNDPGYQQYGGFKYGVNKKEAEIKREKLFQIIRDLVKWENTNNEVVLNRARDAINESWRETCQLNRKHPQAAELFNPQKLPTFHDPFAGGGAIPLEAQRLGLKSYASDLNPVAVMINKAMIEIPPMFVGLAPVGPMPELDVKGNDKIRPGTQLDVDWSGAKGLAEDVRRYGHWMREKAFKSIGHLYPKVKITDELIAERPDLKPYAGEELTVIAWFWARTVTSPNPALSGKQIPLIKSFWLSQKKTNQAWVEIIDTEDGDYTFKVNLKGSPRLEHTVDRKGVMCPFTGELIPFKYVREQAKLGRLENKPLAVVVEGKKGRIYLDPVLLEDVEDVDGKIPDMTIEHWAGCTNCVVYGLDTFDKLFSRRQINALSIFSDLLDEVEKDLRSNGASEAYATAIRTYLAFAIDKAADYWSSMCNWHNKGEKIRNTFGMQAIPMAWDWVEVNPFSSSSGNWIAWINWVYKSLATLGLGIPGEAIQHDAVKPYSFCSNTIISVDPPYYDNVPYSNISDFFYLWMRKNLKGSYPEIFGTMSVPKTPELVANQFRFGGKKEAHIHFMDGMEEALVQMCKNTHPSFPVTIYYAFKQSEQKEQGIYSQGWESFLEAVLNAGFEVHGTWPMSTEMKARTIAHGHNTLASSVVLVCKKREIDAESISRREFQRELRDNMPDSLEAMIGGETGTTPIAPVDLAQSAIGPGMAIYSKYEAILNQDGSKMSVHDALILINRSITDYLNPDSGNFDSDTLFCDDWFSQYGWGEGQFGEADTLARAKGTSVEGVREAGVIEAGGGKVRLLKWSEYPIDWDPKTDARTPIWEACHQMIRVLNQQGESESGALLAKMPERGEAIRQLAYHLYTLCERKKWADEARAYNELIGSWHAIVTASHDVGHARTQPELSLDL